MQCVALYIVRRTCCLCL